MPSACLAAARQAADLCVPLDKAGRFKRKCAMRDRLVWILLAVWTVAFAWSLAAAALTPAEGDGFTRGLNRLIAFFGWQVVAGAAGGMAFILARKLPRAYRSRRWSPAPVAAGLTLVIGLLVLAVLVLLGVI